MRRREGISGIDEKRPGRSPSDCIFCKIVDGKIPSARVFEDDDILPSRTSTRRARSTSPSFPRNTSRRWQTAVPDDLPVLGKMLAQANENRRRPGQPGRFPCHHQHWAGRLPGSAALHMHIVGGPDPVGPMPKRI